MYRAALVSIVLTLALGQDVSLLCRAWCDPDVAETIGCHHGGAGSASPNVASDVSCDYVAPAVFAFLRDDGRRGESVPGRSQAIEIPRYQLAASTSDARLPHEAASPGSLENRPLVTPLRI